MRVVQAMGYHEPRDAISQDWISFLSEVGVAPILVPNGLPDVEAFAHMQQASCLILTNGNDIHPARYGGVAEPGKHYALERDATEFALYEWARTLHIPVVAVCRGFQLLNVAHGGSLVRVPDEAHGGLSHVKASHSVHICDRQLMTDAQSENAQVNSFHNQGVIHAGLGKGLTPFAETKDGMIEGVYSRQYPVLAMQWHPERPGPDSYLQQTMAVRFIREGAWWL